MLVGRSLVPYVISDSCHNDGESWFAQAELDIVERALEEGLSWTEIGRLLRIGSKQAARAKYGPTSSGLGGSDVVVNEVVMVTLAQGADQLQLQEVGGQGGVPGHLGFEIRSSSATRSSGTRAASSTVRVSL